MKKLIFASIIVSASFAACTSNPEGEKAETQEAQQVATSTGAAYTLDSNAVINWAGNKVGGSHQGTFRFKEGSVFVENGNITSGTFIVDINSLTNLDMVKDAEMKGMLEGHLKSPDFFDAAKFPTGKFEITSVKIADSTEKGKMTDATHIIMGNLTLKDSTHNIKFPAKVGIAENNVTVVADFNIDRSMWGMNYKGQDNPKDWIISKEVNLKMNISASKK
jgi:polyisoprenoid-binding protein YceI